MEERKQTKAAAGGVNRKSTARMALCLAAALGVGSMTMSLSACGGKSAADYYKSGVSFLAQGQAEQAEAALAEAVKKNPDRAEYYIDYAFALLENDKVEDAMIQFDKAYSDKDNQIVRENNKKILRGKGIAYLHMNEYEKAKESFEKALKIVEEKDLNRDIRSYLGFTERKLGHFEEAAKIYTTLIEEKKSDIPAYAGRAECYVMLGKVTEAAEDYDTAMALDASNFSLYFGKYNLYTAAGEEEKAKEVLAAAYALKTTTEEDYYNLAIIHYLSGDYDLASVEMTESAAAGFTEAYFYLGSISEKKQDWENALYYYQEYEKTVSKVVTPAWYAGMASCYTEQGKYTEALKMIEQGLKLNDLDYQARLYYQEVFLYEKLTDYEKAAERAEAYLAVCPEDKTMADELIFLRSRIEKPSASKQDTTADEATADTAMADTAGADTGTEPADGEAE